MKDLIIIGGGPAGNAAALAARAAGADSVLLIERDAMGGTCTNRGCIPTKLLLSRSEQLATAAGGVAPRGEWPRLLTYKRGLVRGLARSIGERCRAAGIEVVTGSAVLAGGLAVEVRGPGEEVATHEARRLLLAAGSAPAAIPGVPVDGKVVITSDEALELAEPPSSIVVVGSGSVGSEFATIFRNFGAHVTIVEAAGRLFPHEDPAVDRVLRRHWERTGVTVVTGDAVVAVETRNARAVLTLQTGARIEAERVLIGVGRRLLGPELGCQHAGVELDDRGAVLVDEGHRTTAEGILAAGDVTGRMLLAHVATAEGEAAARSALGSGAPQPVPYRSVPWASFTTPEVGSVGISEEAAASRGIEVASGSADFMDNVKSRIDRTTEGFVKVVARRGSGTLVGATMVGSHASEMIHALAVAIHSGMSADDLAGFVHLHPSASETVADAIADLKSNLRQDVSSA